RFDNAHRAFEDAADDALLPPDLAFAELAVGDEAGELGAGPGAARGTVVRLSRTEDKVPPVGVRRARRAAQFDMVDLGAVGAGNVGSRQGITHGPGDVGKPFHVIEQEALTVIFHQIEPVAAPGNVPLDLAKFGHIDSYVLRVSVACNIVDGDVVRVFE